ncbi:Hsp20/alpha crystallin family protein [Clostridium sp. MSJ-11]|uniref:Hsp20/alpha crystallin family protein n=1 Tax=Clostridium mobile TaxID=2841512 RepID=A0ABS6EFJ2_9CLOT|nr:heat shock protein Hsp18 [Clostridium mobile]MBU5483235.1 Hsp20/alpha crystallin family protein [Clostridium mobile]
MLNMVPFRRNNLNKAEDYFAPFYGRIIDDNFLSSMNYMHESFKVDLKETDENYLVEADLPGTKREDIDIDFNNNSLVISAKRDESSEERKEDYVRRERHYGEFRRSFHIDNVDEDKINASFSDGILKITLPKLTKGKSNRRKIEIN